jgi:tetratricopeptide (TPR) repeat protein
VVALGKAQAQNYFLLGILYAKIGQSDQALTNLAKAVDMEPDKYRQILREELKQIHSVLDSIRYTDRFARLLGSSSPTQSPRP